MTAPPSSLNLSACSRYQRRTHHTIQTGVSIKMMWLIQVPFRLYVLGVTDDDHDAITTNPSEFLIDTRNKVCHTQLLSQHVRSQHLQSQQILSQHDMPFDGIDVCSCSSSHLVVEQRAVPRFRGVRVAFDVDGLTPDRTHREKAQESAPASTTAGHLPCPYSSPRLLLLLLFLLLLTHRSPPALLCWGVVASWSPRLVRRKLPLSVLLLSPEQALSVSWSDTRYLASARPHLLPGLVDDTPCVGPCLLYLRSPRTGSPQHVM